MVATTIRVREFPEEPDQEFFQGLAGLADELKYSVPGFVQGYFMRDSSGGAMVMAVWESDTVVGQVLESSVGKYAREFYDRYLPNGDAERFDITWTAVFGDEYSKLAERREEVDPTEKRHRRPQRKPER